MTDSLYWRKSKTHSCRASWFAYVIPVALAWLPIAGCSFGPRALENTRLRYNEAVKTTTEEQLLLNIVRLRYTDNPSSLAVSVSMKLTRIPHRRSRYC